MKHRLDKFTTVSNCVTEGLAQPAPKTKDHFKFMLPKWGRGCSRHLPERSEQSDYKTVKIIFYVVSASNSLDQTMVKAIQECTLESIRILEHLPSSNIGIHINLPTKPTTQAR